MRALIFLFLIYSIPQLLLGQNSNVRFYNIGVDDGLSHSMATSIAEDSLGFIWFATQDGLNRYDGYDIKVYKAGSSDNAILKNFISDITIDSHNQLWIYYASGGISRYDPVSEIFHHYYADSTKAGSISSTYFRDYSNKVRNMFFEDSDENIWISTNKGVNRYIRETDSFEKILHDPLDTNSLSNNKITYITEGVDKIVWIGTENGLNRYNPHTKEIVRFMPDVSNGGLNDSLITVVKAFSDSSVWVGTTHGGLNIIENANANNQKTTYLLNKSIRPLFDPSVLNIHRTNKESVFVSSQNGLFNIIKDKGNYSIKLIKEYRGELVHYFVNNKEGYVWIGGDIGNSLILANNTGEITNRFSSVKEDIYSFKGELILFMHVSKTGLLWIGTEKGGVYKVNLNTYAFKTIDYNPSRTNYITGKSVFGIYEDDNKNLYVGTNAGLNIINLKNNSVINLHGKKELFNNITYRYSSKLPSSLIGVIKETHDNKIWLGGFDNKISLYDPTTNKFLNFHQNDNDESSFKPWSTRAICVTENGDTYFGGVSFGLCKLNSNKLSFSYSPVVKTNDSNGTNDNRINTIYEDSDSLLWIGTMKGGLNMYNPKTNRFKHYIHNPNDSTSISSNYVNCVFRSVKYDKNIIWVGTLWGLNKFDIKNQKFKAFTTSNGMPNNSIHGILEDEDGNLWISTNRGLAKLDPITEDIKLFSGDDGLQGDEFNGNSYFKNTEGVMYFGGVNGITYFNPRDIEKITTNPSIAFTNFKLFNKVVKANNTTNNRVVLQKSISYSDEIFLDYTDKIISFEFASLYFVSQKKTRYKYKLEGFDDEWNEVGYKQRFANYTNLPSGNYTLKVVATNGDGEWGVPAKLVIHISPPFWETVWFRTSMLLLIIVIVFLIIKLRTKKLLKDKEVLEAVVAEKTRNLSEVNASLEETKEEVLQQNESLVKTNISLQASEQKLLDQNNRLKERDEKISQQNTELVDYRGHLEDMVKVRTSALKVAKLKAEESDRLKSSFLANMSHEIRTPLNAIVGFSSLFSNDGISKEETQEYISIIQNNSNSLLTIISDIIDISSMQVGQLKITKSVFSIDKTLKELKSFYVLKNDKELDIIFVPDSNHQTVHINNDANRFRQIMTNLIGNSFKFTQNGFIKFGYEVIDSKIHFFVHDTGPGIALDAQANIFQYFNKVNVNEDTYHEGTGLGLAISKHLIEQMGGKIRFESEPNNGTKFMFELPYL